METILLALIVALLVLVIAGWLIWQNIHAQQLRARYGTEYERTASRLGPRRAAAELRHREQRVEHLDIRPLSPDQRGRFVDEWQAVQAQFVDDPHGAVRSGDRLVEEVMKARGYPVSDFDQRVADLSVQHPRVVQNYRAAREIGERHRRGEATTEDLRRAMVYYRELFEDLLDGSERRPTDTADRMVERPIARDETRAEPDVRAQRSRPIDRRREP